GWHACRHPQSRGLLPHDARLHSFGTPARQVRKRHFACRPVERSRWSERLTGRSKTASRAAPRARASALLAGITASPDIAAPLAIYWPRTGAGGLAGRTSTRAPGHNGYGG